MSKDNYYNRIIFTFNKDFRRNTKYLKDLYTSTDDKEGLLDIQVQSRKQIVSDFLSALNRVKAEIEKKYLEYINSKDDEFFPTKWMKNDPEIMTSLDRYKPFKPILNYLYNDGRYITPEQYERLEKETEGRYKGCPFALVSVDQAFYEELAREAGCTVPYVKRIWTWFIKEGIVRKIDGRRLHRLYATGYYKRLSKNRIKKLPFVSILNHRNAFRHINFSGKS